MTTKKRMFASMLVLSLLSAAGHAGTTIGVSMAAFDDNFLTQLREAMAAQSKTLKDVSLQFEDARNDVGRQVSQVENFVTRKVGAIIVSPVDTTATKRMSAAARKAGIPVIYVNRKPSEQLGNGVYYIGSQNRVAGQLQMEYLAKQLNGKGTVAVIQGALSDEGAIERTAGVKDVAAKFPGIKITEVQNADWNRNQAIDLTRKWLSSGRQFNAIAANNDEMALGALIAIKQSNVSPSKVLVGGVDATPDALGSLAKGELAVTVFQDAKGQGKGAVDIAAKVAAGDKKVPNETMIPFQLVTPANYKTYLNK
ncbi:MAG: sugar ABC transporter substrate-binding protein [Pseudogulbenkiania sp.]|nr:sugar ABC transporter substrate-binding protein [Pseudogulbenkiania sp.]